MTNDATHGVQMVDFDGDGRLDSALTNNAEGGGHPLFRNVIEGGGRGLNVRVENARGHAVFTGAEVRVYEAGTTRLLSAGLVDGGSGYCSQSEAPVFLPLGSDAPSRVDIKVTVPASGERRRTLVQDIDTSIRFIRVSAQ